MLAQFRPSAPQLLQCLALVGGPLADLFTVFLTGMRHRIQAADGAVIVQGTLHGALAQRIGGLTQLLHVVAQLLVLAAGSLAGMPTVAAAEASQPDGQPQQQVGGDLHGHTAVPGQPAAI